jgi:hypothetical protein
MECCFEMCQLRMCKKNVYASHIINDLISDLREDGSNS